MIHSRAPGRVCLLGDKNDLLKGPVIAAAISKFFDFHFKPVNAQIIRFNFPQRNLHFERKFNENIPHNFFKFLNQISWRLKDKIAPFECTIDGDLPIGAGLSSSAACSVGFIDGLNKMFDMHMNLQDIAELAYQVERNDFGIMCGRMDQFSVTYGGITYIETGETPKVTLLRNVQLPFIIGDSCEPRHAANVLNMTMEKLRQNDHTFKICFDVIDRNVKLGLKAIERNDLVELGARMSIHQEMERAMGATTKKLDEMCYAAIEAGALGAKQIGAGGGGCMIALCPHNMDKVMKAIKSIGANVWKANIYYHPIA